MAAAEPLRNKKDVKKMADYYLKKGQNRNYLLIVLGVYTALRISDLLRLRWSDVYDFERGKFYNKLRLTERKTGKFKQIALNANVISALQHYFGSLKDADRDGFLFASRNRKSGNAAISRIQAYRVIKAAAVAVGITERVSCHSLRKTFGYHAWKNNVPLAVIMDIYNHASFTVTRRYLGVAQDDRDKAYMKLRFVL
jgi:integrase